MTDNKLAKLFGVCKATITNWKRDHPEFLASVHKGKREFDTDKVADAMLKRALGYKYKEVTKEMGFDPISEPDPDDPEKTVVIAGKPVLRITKEVTKHMAGDVGAQKMWLVNRAQRDPETGEREWNNVSSVQLSGPDGKDLKIVTEIGILPVKAPERPPDETTEAPAEKSAPFEAKV